MKRKRGRPRKERFPFLNKVIKGFAKIFGKGY